MAVVGAVTLPPVKGSGSSKIVGSCECEWVVVFVAGCQGCHLQQNLATLTAEGGG